ncbi:hypothetical protein OROHE_003712 [Orobanche hederae]
MRRFGIEGLFPLDIEIECTLRKSRKEKQDSPIPEIMGDNNGNQANVNANQQAQPPLVLRDYALPQINANFSRIRRPTIQTNNFEIKPAIIQMVQASQFCGLANNDPNAHIASFLEICDTFKNNGVTDDGIRLRLFPLSLRDKAKIWLNSLPPGSITTWAELAQAFLAKFFSPAKTARLRNDITTFCQYEMELLHEAWERYKDLLRRCHHGLPDWLQIQIFYNGLSASTRTLVDAAAGGALMGKTMVEAHALLEAMAANAYQWPSERVNPKRVMEISNNNLISTVSAQVAALTQQLQKFSHAPSTSTMESCNWCSGAHPSVECQVGNPFEQSQMEPAQFVGNGNRQSNPLPQNNPYSNT